MLLYVSILFQDSPLQTGQVALLFAVSEGVRMDMISFMLTAIEIGVIETLLVPTDEWTATVARVLTYSSVLIRICL